MEKTQILAKIEEIVTSHGLLLIDVAFRGDNRFHIIEIFIDSEKSITTTDCVNISREINEKVQSQNLVDSKYRLDVSSPGVDRPLKFSAQYKKHINRNFELEFKVGEEVKKVIAKLIRIDGDDLYFSEKESEYKINFTQIVKAKVLISF